MAFRHPPIWIYIVATLGIFVALFLPPIKAAAERIPDDAGFVTTLIYLVGGFAGGCVALLIITALMAVPTWLFDRYWSHRSNTGARDNPESEL